MRIALTQSLSSFRAWIALFGITIAFVTCGLLGWTAYQQSRETIISNAKRTVGVIATARKEALVRALKNCAEKANNFLTLVNETCGKLDEPIQPSCVRQQAHEFITFNGAESALIFVFGRTISTNRQDDLKTFSRANWLPTQLAQFEIGADGRSHFIVRARSDELASQFFVRFSSGRINGLFQDKTGLGHSGETFLTDKEGMFLTDSRYPSHSGFSHPINARPMVDCLAGKEQEVLDPDYRNVDVIHGFRSVPEMGGGCVMAHIDQKEAFAPAKELRSQAIWIAFSVSLLAVFVSLAFSHFMVRPIRLLTSRALALQKGDLDSPIPQQGPSELRAFAETFSSMTHSLKTSRYELSERERKFRSIFESSHDAIVIIDMGHDRIIDANPSACELLRYDQGTLLQTAISKIHPSEMQKLSAFARMVKEKGHGWTDEFTCTTRNGDCLSCEISASLLEFNGGEQILAIIRDISERKTAEQKITEQAEKLARSNADLERFASVAAHDLQEPLRTVASFCSLLHRKSKGNLDDDCKEYMHFITDGASRMQRLIQDLLSYARVDTTRKELEVVNSNLFVLQAKENLSVAIRDSHVVVTNSYLPERLFGDRTQLLQLFQNLIANAIKYRRRGVAPKVHVTATREGDMWRFVVQDNGIGIAKEHQNQIFEIFRRLHSRQEYEGTGIGLATCQKIVERHGGRIWVESEVGGGAQFNFTLRAAPSSDQAELSRSRKTEPGELSSQV